LIKNIFKLNIRDTLLRKKFLPNINDIIF